MTGPERRQISETGGEVNEDQREALRQSIAEAEQAMASGAPMVTIDDVAEDGDDLWEHLGDDAEDGE